jgi:hypothetical protein
VRWSSNTFDGNDSLMFNLLYRSLQHLTENGSPPFDLALRCIPPSLGSRVLDGFLQQQHAKLRRAVVGLIQTPFPDITPA